MPAAQSVQLDENGGDALPGGQAEHVAPKKPLAGVPLEMVPEGHGMHELKLHRLHDEKNNEKKK